MSESLTSTTSDVSSLSTQSTAPSTPSTSPTLELADPTATQTRSDFFSPSVPSPTETPRGNDSPNFATTSSLYLFTFLATLLLLLAISCAIVIRSLIIRRRFQRRVQEALAEGVVLPAQAAGDVRGMGRMGPGGPGGGLGGPGGRRRDFGEKPKMWDAHLAPPEDVANESKWESLMPVSVRIQHDKLTGSGQQPPAPPPPRQGFLHSASFGLVNNQNWRPRFFRSRRPSDHSATPSGPSDSAQLNSGNNSADASQESNTQQSHEPTIRSEDAQLQVSVLIAMPSPYRPRAWRESLLHGLKGKSRSRYGSSSTGSTEGDGEEDEELPDVVLGTAEMPWKVVVHSHQIASSSSSVSGDRSAPVSGRRLEGNESQSDIQMHTLRPRELSAPFTSASGAR